MEERLAVLETKVDHIQSDVADMKLDIRKLNDTVDTKFGGLEKKIHDLQLSRAFDRVWWLLNSAALLGVMARGFKWI